MWIFCIDYALWPAIYVYNNAINAIGRSDIYLQVQIKQKIIGLVVLAICIRHSVLAVAITVPILSMIELVMIMFRLRKLINYALTDQISDLFPPALLAIIMGFIIICINPVNVGYLFIILLRTIIGAVIYIVGASIYKMDALLIIVETTKKLTNKK